MISKLYNSDKNARQDPTNNQHGDRKPVYLPERKAQDPEMHGGVHHNFRGVADHEGHD